MSETKSNSRSYTSPLRRNQKENTRDLILDTVAEMISEGRILDFSVKDVAVRAGISYGTVYRHFPTRESILEALYEVASEIMAQSSPFTPQSLDDIPAMVGKNLEVFEERATLVQAFTVALLVNNVQPNSRHQRDQKIQEMVMESTPHLSSGAARQVAAIISHLCSSLTWATLKQRYGLNSEETAEALNWALQTLIQDITRHEED
ncbi:TetR/AcrR family transcriptional regulator [Desulfosporosinus nitroreducens]|uniref:TetR/AcrR family transcriptional regulator n=1 Tax=Desulfosporosinus nitroreducens TaxID=2018668 RepID=A0ABT8QSU9_9FIRM|nr:TetR/AcrR family transcriptional regulator [Desulfosporosinus nitroreducens]MCO1601098.1 TetR/AcrR family transcriptional regulator [Desulfosporosinus nitroreducens]MDO0824438.1 TetR/AcrR family transcriptional regulator [Desulfosporosinus nitroreducens]